MDPTAVARSVHLSAMSAMRERARHHSPRGMTAREVEAASRVPEGVIPYRGGDAILGSDTIRYWVSRARQPHNARKMVTRDSSGGRHPADHDYGMDGDSGSASACTCSKQESQHRQKRSVRDATGAVHPAEGDSPGARGWTGSRSSSCTPFAPPDCFASGANGASRSRVRRIDGFVDEVPSHYPGASGDCGSICVLHGSESTCSAPCISASASPYSLTLDTLSLSGFSGTEAEAMEAAWMFLQANVDVIDWVSCWLTGAVDDRISSTLTDTSAVFRTKIRLDNTNSCSGVANTSNGPIERITICGPQTAWRRFYAAWTCGSGDDVMCALVDFAGTLLHELTHYVDLDVGDPLGGGNCYTSYRFENMFRWAMYQRYPDAALSACCSSQASQRLWNDDGSYIMTCDCM